MQYNAIDLSKWYFKYNGLVITDAPTFFWNTPTEFFVQFPAQSGSMTTVSFGYAGGDPLLCNLAGVPQVPIPEYYTYP